MRGDKINIVEVFAASSKSIWFRTCRFFLVVVEKLIEVLDGDITKALDGVGELLHHISGEQKKGMKIITMPHSFAPTVRIRWVLPLPVG